MGYGGRQTWPAEVTTLLHLAAHADTVAAILEHAEGRALLGARLPGKLRPVVSGESARACSYYSRYQVL